MIRRIENLIFINVGSTIFLARRRNTASEIVIWEKISYTQLKYCVREGFTGHLPSYLKIVEPPSIIRRD